jgi:hypothetical protein
MPPDRVWYPRCRSLRRRFFGSAHRGDKNRGLLSAVARLRRTRGVPLVIKVDTQAREENCTTLLESLVVRACAYRPDISEH